MSVNITAIIPTHNRPKAFYKCLTIISNIKQKEILDFLFILDGCSNETWKIASLFKLSNITMLKGDGNLFWGGAIAIGMEKAFNDFQASAVLWLNDDSDFEVEDVVKIAEAHAKVPNAIIGGKLVAKNLNNIPIYPTGETTSYGYERVPYLNGNFTLIPRIVYETIGNIDPNRFPHFADAPYLEKARRYGFECLVIDDIKIGIHYDIIRHLPLYIQVICFKEGYFKFWNRQLMSKKSKWFFSYRWYYTREKFKQFAIVVFLLIFLRDFSSVSLAFLICFLPTKYKARVVLLISQHILHLPTYQIEELEKEIAWMID